MTLYKKPPFFMTERQIEKRIEKKNPFPVIKFCMDKKTNIHCETFNKQYNYEVSRNFDEN